MTPLQALVEVNPSTPAFDALSGDALVSFLPLEAVWPGSRLDTSRIARRSQVQVGYTRFQTGDILVPKITPTFEAGRSTIARDLLGGVGAGTTELHVLRPRPGTDARFIAYLTQSQPFLTNGHASMTGVAGQKRVSADWVRRFEVAITDADTQRNVADHLDREMSATDSVVEQKLRLIHLLRQRWDAVVDRTVRRGLEDVPFRESGIVWLGHVPEHWETRPLITTLMAVQNGTWGDEPTGTPTDVACVRVADFDRLRLTVQDRELTQRSVAPAELARHRLRPGDLLLEKSGGGDVQPVGKVVLFDQPFDAVCSNFVARLSIRSDHHRRYCAYLHDVLYRARVNVRSIKQSTGIQNLDSGSYLRELVCIPPLEEQRSIAGYLDHETAKLDRLVASIQDQIAKLHERRSTLITAMVKGRRVSSNTGGEGRA